VSYQTWQAFYYGDWQQPWALLVVPFAFLVWRAAAAAPGPGVVPEARAFVVRWSAVFVGLTMLDPIATGPLAKALGGGGFGTALGLGFVLVGDFRIWWLVLGLRDPRAALSRAALATVAVPIFAWLATQGIGAAVGPPPDQVLWLIHESTFLVLATLLARRRPAGFERSVLAYAAVYYALWAACDVLILAGVDAGWLLRCLPNQLYYGLTVPYVWWCFFAPSYTETSPSTQASR
jgi:hypothetical protein